ncbi:hypothetical protein KW800_02710 [Candidatus Parcubacteria bacterium]|nr:hypothetical protein [Candidatus Parcubacteria bacterium]
MCLASVIGASNTWAQDTSKKAQQAEEEKHTSAYCAVFGAQCKQERALQRVADSLRQKVTAYENGSACAVACKTMADSLKKKIVALQLAQQNLTQGPAKLPVVSTPRPTPRPVGTKSAVTRVAQPSQNVPVVKTERQIARIDSVPFPVFVHDTTIVWQTHYDTVYVTKTLTDRGGIHWKGLAKWGALAGAACMAEGMFVNRDWRQPYCINIRVKSSSSSGTGK